MMDDQMTDDQGELSSDYPRTYRSASAPILKWAGVFMLLLVFLGLLKHLPPEMTFDGVCFLILGIWLILLARSQWVILDEDAIEIGDILSPRQMKRSEIKGRQMGKVPWQVGGGLYYILIPQNEKEKKLQLHAFLHYDKPFHFWMESIPSIERAN